MTMLEFLRETGNARRFALFCIVACRQQGWTIDDTRSCEAVEWAEQLVEKAVTLDDGSGPSDGDCYLMGAAANNCMGAAMCACEGDSTGTREYTLNVVEFLLDGDEESSQLAELIREIFGNPFRPVAIDPRWLTETVVALATGIYAERAFDRMPILADALEEAGCDHADILSHCRGDGPHVRGCWVVDLLLGKE
jgi:hypothetical protein